MFPPPPHTWGSIHYFLFSSNCLPLFPNQQTMASKPQISLWLAICTYFNDLGCHPILAECRHSMQNTGAPSSVAVRERHLAPPRCCCGDDAGIACSTGVTTLAPSTLEAAWGLAAGWEAGKGSGQGEGGLVIRL